MGGRSFHRVAKSVRQNPRVRRIAIPTYRRVTRMISFGSGPRVLINSMPKAGTHLLTTLLRKFPGVIHSGQHYVLDDFRNNTERPPIWGELPEVDWARLDGTFGSLNRGQFMTAHIPAVPELLSILDAYGYGILCIIRDPRDVVVSSAIYMTNLQRHVMHHVYSRRFETDEDRILATITGFGPSEHGRGAISIGTRVAMYMPWLYSTNVLTCRFENLIGPAGGGRAEAQRREIEMVARHLDYSFAPEQIDRLADQTWTMRSPTFRKGSIGDWRNHFTEEHKAAFKEVAGQHLITLGYERDLDW